MELRSSKTPTCPRRPNRCAGSPRRRRPGGFTLAEVLIAIGLMGVGLTMAAALFPAAIKEHQKSYNDAVGTFICENAFAVAKTKLTAADVSGNTLMLLADESYPDLLSLDDQHYAAGAGTLQAFEKQKGFVLLGRKDGDVFQLVAVPYARDNDPSHRVEAATVNGAVVVTADATTLTVQAGERDFLTIGSPVIRKSTGEFRRIVSIDGSTATLDRDINVPPGSEEWFVIVETNGGSVVGDTSPAMSVMVTRTALPQ